MTRAKDGAEMVYVPAGNFIMGGNSDDPDAREDEFPAHTVFVDAFWIDKYEVTIDLYQKCANEGVCTKLYIVLNVIKSYPSECQKVVPVANLARRKEERVERQVDWLRGPFPP